MSVSTPKGSVMEMRPIILSPEDRVAAEELAALLGVSSSDLIQEFENLTPEEHAEFERLVDQANEILPELHESLDRIGEGIARCNTTIREMMDQTAAMSERVSGIEKSLGMAEAQ